MIIINPNKHILFDASVLVAAFNKLDSSHQKAIDYIRAMPEGKVALLPAHCLFEFMAAISRKRELRGHYLSFEKDQLKIPFDNISVTQELANNARDQKLFEVSKTLRGGDLVYACVAKIYSLPLVTFDSHFEPYKNDIVVHIL